MKCVTILVHQLLLLLLSAAWLAQALHVEAALAMPTRLPWWYYVLVPGNASWQHECGNKGIRFSDHTVTVGVIYSHSWIHDSKAAGSTVLGNQGRQYLKTSYVP